MPLEATHTFLLRLAADVVATPDVPRLFRAAALVVLATLVVMADGVLVELPC